MATIAHVHHLKFITCVLILISYSSQVIGQPAVPVDPESTLNGKPDSQLVMRPGPDPKNDQRESLWRESIGKQVRAQGIAWNFNGKGYGPYVIMRDYRVYISGQALEKIDAEGKIVEVIGNLMVENIPRLPAGYQTFGVGKRYFIDVTQVRILDRLKWPDIQRID